MNTMALAALVHPTGTHVASWLHPGTQANASTDIDYYRSMAQLAERGMFDLFFIADTPAARPWLMWSSEANCRATL
jgi:alkanesulfonate monooxygenase SsuD/methylene tetrahydromethanopterin reductase-like flavin-dependent oxidoreductase (luciferase family)